MSPFSYHSIFGWSLTASITPFSPREPSTKTDVFPLLLFRSLSIPLFRRFLNFVLWRQFGCCCCRVVGWLCIRFGILIENNALSNASVFRLLHFESAFKCFSFRFFQVETTTRNREIPLRLHMKTEWWKRGLSSVHYYRKDESNHNKCIWNYGSSKLEPSGQ